MPKNKIKIPNYDPDNPRQDHLDFLKECIAKGKEGIAEWNKFRKDNPDEEIWLQKAVLEAEAYLKNADLESAHLEDAYLEGVNLENADLRSANLENANLGYAHLKNACLAGAHLENAYMCRAHLENAKLREIHLENSKLEEAHLENANLCEAHLENAILRNAHLENADLRGAHLENANLEACNLRGADFTHCDLQNARFSTSIVDGGTCFWKCAVNRWQPPTKDEHGREFYTGSDFNGVGLDSMRIDPETKQLLEHNIQRRAWNDWYKKHKLIKFPVHSFWLFSNYGFSTWSIIKWFFIWALLFAAVYSFFGDWLSQPIPGLIDNLAAKPHQPLWHYFLLIILRPIYFSVVTMTTLGFGDMYAHSNSILGHVLLILQVMLGYILLGALVTRLAFLFRGGPAGEFTPVHPNTKALLERIRQIEWETKFSGNLKEMENKEKLWVVLSKDISEGKYKHD